ncbi:hypothetical protein [Sphingobacterium mizutaii]|nr:hypothetical protein [Sphingobacterium mizutaii]
MSIKKNDGHSPSRIEDLFVGTIFDIFDFDFVSLRDASDEPTKDKFN